MFELVIIISLAVIFFIFLGRMPEVERIKEIPKGKKVPLFERLVPAAAESKEPEKNDGAKDIRFEAERKLKFGDLEGAEKLYLRLAVISPHDQSIYAALGKIYFNRMNYKDAVAAYKAAISRDGKNGFYYYDLAEVLFKAERFEEAKICFEKSISINNRIPIRHLGLGLAQMKIKDFKGAVDSFAKACEIEPNNEKYRRLLRKAKAKIYSKTLN